MRISDFSLAAVFALAIAIPSPAAEKPRPAQASQNRPKKLWTNEDMDQLHVRGLISIVGPEAKESAAPSTGEANEPASPVYSSNLEDPDWYAQQAASLQAELDKREAALRDAQVALAQAADRITQSGINMAEGNAGVTPEAGIVNLQADVIEVQNQLDELSELARQNNIPPGVLRG